MIELKLDSIVVAGAEYHISNINFLRRATELELDVVEPSIICHSTTATEKVVILDDMCKEDKLNILRKVVKEYGNCKN